MILFKHARNVFFLISAGIFALSSFHGFAQNLLQESTWQLTGEKKNFYSNQGVFFYDLKKVQSITAPKASQKDVSTLIAIRSRFDKGKKTLRLVLDFSSPQMNPLYGHISAEKKKLFIDFFQTIPAEAINKSIKTTFLESINILQIEKNSTTVEMQFSDKYLFEVFTLNNPARLVIDIKK